MSSRRITIFDTTLRDGEQSPGIALRPDEKVEIGEQLERLGVDVIEAGFAASSPGDFEGVRAVARGGERADRSPRSAARRARGHRRRREPRSQDAPRSRIHIFLATSALHMEKKLRLRPDEVVAQARGPSVTQRVRERRRGRVLVRGRDPIRPGVRRQGLPSRRRGRRDDDQPPGHRRLHAARPSTPTSSARYARLCPELEDVDALGPLPRRPRARGRQLARGASTPACSRSSARSTASASAPATPRSRRS